MTGAVRWARILVLAVWSVALGVLAHALGGGPLPSASLTGLMVGVAALLAAPALEREQRLPVLLGWALLAQVGVHLTLLHHAPQPGPAGPATLVHLLAAALLAGWLRGGEAAVWRLLRRLVPGRPRRAGPLVVPVAGAGGPAGRPLRRAIGRTSTGAVGLRAPPRALLPA